MITLVKLYGVAHSVVIHIKAGLEIYSRQLRFHALTRSLWGVFGSKNCRCLFIQTTSAALFALHLVL